MQQARPIDVYDRVWNDGEIAGAGDAVRRLGVIPALFDARQGPAELPAHGGPLSIKMVADGATDYVFGQRRYRVVPGEMLVVAAGHVYATRIERTAHIVTAYLPGAYVADAAAVIATPDDIPQGQALAIDFAPHRRIDVSGLRHRLERLARIEDDELRREGLALVAGAAAAFALDAMRATGRIGASKSAVRQELFRRVCLVRDRIHAAPHLVATLDALAAHAALSPFHLLRVFSAAFGETPAQMRRRLCLERAEALLAAGTLLIGEIAFKTGYENPSAFSRAFRRHAGRTPAEFRDAC